MKTVGSIVGGREVCFLRLNPSLSEAYIPYAPPAVQGSS